MNDKEHVEPARNERWNINSWEELRQALANMKPKSKLYKTVKTELTKKGHWRNAPRGPWNK